MKIVSWNVNGYRAAYKKGFADWLTSAKPEVMCIQETKAWEEQLTGPQKSPGGYQAQYSQPYKKGYSGVATFTPAPVDSSRLGIGVEEFDGEGRILTVDIGDLKIANIYFPNGKSKTERLKYKMDFNEAVLQYFGEMAAKGQKLVVLGDVNTAHKPIDLEHPKANEKTSGFLPEERDWIDRWLEAGFIDSFREFNSEPKQYTWWDMRTRARDRNVGWRIDYIFISRNLRDRLKDGWIMPDVMGSDHCPLGIEID